VGWTPLMLMFLTNAFRGAKRIRYFKIRVAKNARGNTVYSGTEYTFIVLFYYCIGF
jgi:hypothetical protein